MKWGDGQNVEHAWEDKKCIQNFSQDILWEKTAWSKKAVMETQNVPYKTQHQDQTVYILKQAHRRLPVRCSGHVQQFLSRCVELPYCSFLTL